MVGGKDVLVGVGGAGVFVRVEVGFAGEVGVTERGVDVADVLEPDDVDVAVVVAAARVGNAVGVGARVGVRLFSSSDVWKRDG